jgi:hypothetical protein
MLDRAASRDETSAIAPSRRVAYSAREERSVSDHRETVPSWSGWPGATKRSRRGLARRRAPARFATAPGTVFSTPASRPG